ncbi:MAG: hydroxyacylglutathione hydrolase [Wenzhouxiangellaceae bacterium]|nr:hydroxyacylglutathione hydrolase [Wenzhouxiangellaceae bacterium]
MELQVEAVRALSDNFIWVLHDGDSAVAVDPGESDGLLAFLQRHGLDLDTVLLTHHHWDHVDGVDAVREHTGCSVLGPDDDRVPDGTQRVAHGETVRTGGPGLEFEVLGVPGHTRSHIAFHGHDLVLTGDTLFSAGCGKLFEGTPEQMQTSLDRLAGLPEATRVFCGHEYTVSNCEFALRVEPGNEALARRLEQARRLREEDADTLPSTIGDEKRYNPFLRTREPSVVEAASRHAGRSLDAGAETLGVVRAWKDGD